MNHSSSLYVGEIEHRRFQPRSHEFRYSVLYYFLDLDEIPHLFRFPGLFSYNCPGILSFWRRNYLGTPEKDLKQCVQQYIKEKTGEDFNGSIHLLTNISYFGICFNPVSFYYCYSEDQTLKYIVSEVTNTPWGERHQHLIVAEPSKTIFHRCEKDFHVSPFMPMAIDYSWLFSRPGEELEVMMQNRLAGENDLYFDSRLRLQRKDLTSKNIALFFLRFPLVTVKTMAAIYYQAMRLYFKVPFYGHPTKEKVHDNSRAT